MSHLSMLNTLARSRAIAVASVIALAACGSDSGPGSGPDAPAEAPTSSGQPLASGPAETSDVAPDSITPDSIAPTNPAAADPGSICDSIPGLDEISAIVGEVVTTFEDNSSPSVEIDGDLLIGQRCDVSGEGFGAAIFERIDLESGATLIDAIEAEGLQVDMTWPDLPDAIAWANSVMIEQDGLYVSATAITPATVGVADAPDAYEASAALLRAWLIH